MLSTFDRDRLDDVRGGMNADARWIMMHESRGNTHAGHLHASRRHSSAFGAFQMIEANRRHYMGHNYQSTDFGAQYSAASHYARDRYGSWSGAHRFWNSHGWY